MLKFRMESEAVLTKSEVLFAFIKLVCVIRSLLCGVKSRLTDRGRREIPVTGYVIVAIKCCEHCIKCIAVQL